MALHAVVYQQGLFGLDDGNKDLHSLLENWSWDFNLPEGDHQHYPHEPQEYNGYLTNVVDNKPESSRNSDHDQNPWELSSLVSSFSNNELVTAPTSNSSEADLRDASDPPKSSTEAPLSTMPKRRRAARCRKNKEDIESQRMTHIAVERNRRKQMNQYLAVLKSLMPDSYAQRGDQASIVGGAINFVKELEQSLHCLNARKAHMNHNPEGECSSPPPFGEFFSSPQYSTKTDPGVGDEAKTSTIADVEVSMAESHVNLKIRLRKHPKQLLKVVTGLQHLRLAVLHLNVSTVDQFVLYSVNLKVDDNSNLPSVDEIAASVHQLLVRIQEEVQLS